jgi:hypothetical protein
MKIPQTTYSKYERAALDPTPHAEKFANFFKVSMHDLLYGEIKPSPEQVKIHPRSTCAPLHITDAISLSRNTLRRLLDNSSASLFDRSNYGSDCFTVSSPDRSMAPQVLPNDILGFNFAIPAKPADFVLVKLHGIDNPLFRIYYPLSNGGAIYEAINPSIEKITAAPGKWENLGRLQFIIKPVETLG